LAGKLESEILKGHTIVYLRREDDKILISGSLEGAIVVWVNKKNKNSQVEKGLGVT
jgi:hypothetical protein